MPNVMKCRNPACGRLLSPGVRRRCDYCGAEVSLPQGGKPTMDPGVFSTGDAHEPGASPTGAPRRIARYEVREWLGAGAFGDVYRAYDPQLDREVAVKVLKAGAADPRQAERLLGEARAAARLRHPHIVPVFDAGQDAGLSYIATAYIPGGALEEAIEDGKPLDFRRAAGIVRDLAEALAYAHQCGIVHRDLKPANVLLDENGRPHLADFGLAYRLTPAGSDPQADCGAARPEVSGRTIGPGRRQGTAAYMAPEAWAGAAGAASDQYSLGIVLYELLCGHTPFAGPTPDVIEYHHIHREPKPPHEDRRGVPADLEAICLRALAKEPGRRYADCRMMADDLRRWLDGEEVSVRRPGAAERLARWRRREPMLATTAVAALLLLITAAVVSTVLWVREGQNAKTIGAERDKVNQSNGDLEAANQKLQDANVEIQSQNQALQAAHADLRRQIALTEGERKTAVSERDQKSQALKDLEQSQSDLQKSKTRLEVEGYFHLTTLAGQALQDGAMPRAAELLADLGRSADHLHGWEWDYVHREYDRRAAELKSRTDLANSFAGQLLGKDWVLARAQPGTGVKVWQIGHKAYDLPNTRDVVCVAFSPDGRRLAAGGRDGLVTVWDVENPQKCLSTHVHGDGKTAVGCVAFSIDPAGALLASGGDDGSVRVWDPDAPRAASVPCRRPTSASPVRSLALMPPMEAKTPQLLLSAGADAVVTAWRVDPDGDDKPVYTFRGYTSVALSASRDGMHDVLLGGLAREDGMVRVYRLNGGDADLKVELEGFHERLHGLTFVANGARIAAAGARAVKVWEISGKVSGTIKTADGRFALLPLVFGDQVAVLQPDGSPAVWSVLVRDKKTAYDDNGKESNAPEKLFLDAYDQHVVAVAYDPAGKRLISAAAVPRKKDPAAKDKPATLLAGELKAWNPAGGEQPHFAEEGEQPPEIACIACDPSPALPFLAAGCRDGTVRVWDLTTGKPAPGFLLGARQHDDEVWSLAFRPGAGNWLASAGKDKAIKIWDMGNRQLRAALPGAASVNAVAFSPDGKRLAAAGADGVVTLWNTASEDPADWKEEFRLDAFRRAGFNAVAFSPEGSPRLAAGGDDQLVRIWDVNTREVLHTLTGHTGAISAVAFTPDGGRLASASEDATVCLWDVRTGQEALCLKGEARFSYTLTFSPDRSRLTTASVNGVRFWEGRPLAGR